MRHVLARHDPLRCAETTKRGGVRFRGNELLGMVAVGTMEVRNQEATTRNHATLPNFADEYYRCGGFVCVPNARLSRAEGQMEHDESNEALTLFFCSGFPSFLVS